MFAASQGADMLGFILYEKSPRYCDPESARRIIASLKAALPHPPLTVGVFVNSPLAAMLAIARKCELDAIQLHGFETNETAASLRREGYKVFKAFRITGAEAVQRFADFQVDGYLCDTSDPNLWGGTGQTFDHTLLTSAARRYRIILAGGLTPENVAAAVRLVQPWAVDVASGVEAAPGRKSPEKVAAFIQAARSSLTTQVE